MSHGRVQADVARGLTKSAAVHVSYFLLPTSYFLPLTHACIRTGLTKSAAVHVEKGELELRLQVISKR